MEPRIIIIYASLTGCNEDLAKMLFNFLKTKGNHPKLVDIESAEAKEFLDYDLCIMVSYSYESFDDILPEEMYDFYNEMKDLDLSGKIFGVMGTGQDIYDDFCGAVDKLERQFINHGAIKGSNSLKFDFDVTEDTDIEKVKVFADEMIRCYHKKHENININAH